MVKMKYDIFISYRRDGGAQYARILQLMLIKRGYKVFLDYDELTDGKFRDKIQTAIMDAPVFMLVLSKGSMERCVNEDDWVRREITLAMELNKHIVPINPDGGFDGFPQNMPKELKEMIAGLQYSDISFGQSLGLMIDFLIKNRLVDTLGRRSGNEQIDEEIIAARGTICNHNAKKRNVNELFVVCSLCVTTILLGVFIWFWKCQNDNTERNQMRAALHEKYSKFHLLLNSDLTAEQMSSINIMLANMVEVYPDSIWISKFEFSRGHWRCINGEPFNEDDMYLPVTNVSFADIIMRLGKLGDMTNLLVELPSAEVWEYSAHAGKYNEATIYSGDSIVDNVAWSKENSGGSLHPSDGRQGKEPNMLDLYDMSGNVSEICNTSYDNNGLYTLCGGNYGSLAEEVCINSRRGFPTDAKDETVGFRIIIRKP